MADFTKIDERVVAALFAKEPSLKQDLAEIAPSGTHLHLGPCGQVIEAIARTAFGAAIETAAENPELATKELLRPHLMELRPHLIEVLIGERERAAVFEQTRVERNRVIDDHSLIGAGKGELFVAGSVSDSWKVAPAEVQVVHEPVGFYERLAPPGCRYVMRGNATLARKFLGNLFDAAVERFFTKWLADPERVDASAAGVSQGGIQLAPPPSIEPTKAVNPGLEADRRPDMVAPKAAKSKKAGAPQREQTRRIHEEFATLNQSTITAKACDAIAKKVFAAEAVDAGPGTTAHRRLRERVRAALHRNAAPVN